MKAESQTFCSGAVTWFRLMLVVSLATFAFGCSPKIGGECATSTDCSINGDRLCDVTLPGGYCTVFNCEPNGCPDNAACVAFSEGTCTSPAVSTRFRRTFCMATCDDDSDCRSSDYKCIDISRDPARQVVDGDPPKRRICTVPSSFDAPPAADAGPTVYDPQSCFPSDAAFDLSRPETGPRLPDASTDVAEASSPDRADTLGDMTSTDRRADQTVDTSDSSRGETGTDGLDDTFDEQAIDATDDALDDATDGADDASPVRLRVRERVSR